MAAFLSRHWFLLVLTLGVGATLVWPGAIGRVTSFWEPRLAVGFALFLMAWTMPTYSLFAEVRQPYAALWAVIVSYTIVPAGAWLLGYLASEDVQIGLLLVASVPCTLSSAILWTRMADGNEATALLTVLGTTFTSWFLTTAWLYWLTGAELALNVADMMRDLVLSLILPVLIGQALRLMHSCAAYADRHRLAIGILSQAFVLAIVLKAGVSVGERLHAEDVPNAPVSFVWSVVLAVTLHLGTLAVGYVSSAWFGFERGRRIAVAFSASQKTLQVSLVLFEQYFKARYPFAVMPLLCYHFGQLLLDTVIARQMTKHGLREPDTAT